MYSVPYRSLAVKLRELFHPSHIAGELAQVMEFPVQDIQQIVENCGLSLDGIELTRKCTEKHGVAACVDLWQFWRSKVEQYDLLTDPLDQRPKWVLQAVAPTLKTDLTLLPLVLKCLPWFPLWTHVESLFESPTRPDLPTPRQFEKLLRILCASPPPADPKVLLSVLSVGVRPCE